jgi:cytidylate kinase
MIVAIDGPAASGKSTTAKEVARRLNWLYMDTGAMYRAVTLACMRRKINLNEPDEIRNCGEKQNIDQKNIQGETHTFLNGEDVTEEIRLPEVSRNVKPVADHPEIRSFLVELQRAIGKGKNAVVDGRDIGTVVFPDAELKFFMTASIEERARRRYEELKNKGIEADLEAIKKDIEERDWADKSRPVGALKKADDAVEIDTTALTIEQQIDFILEKCHGLMKK